MTDQTYIVSEIKLKIIRLKESLRALSEKNSELLKQLEEVKKTIENQKNTIKSLEEKNKIVNIADTLIKNQGDSSEARRLLNGYIREIEECIRLLSER